MNPIRCWMTGAIPSTANDSTLFDRVFLRAGAQVPGGIAGLECSWLSGGKLVFGADNATIFDLDFGSAAAKFAKVPRGTFP
jgi:hypothetical protein